MTGAAACTQRVTAIHVQTIGLYGLENPLELDSLKTSQRREWMTTMTQGAAFSRYTKKLNVGLNDIQSKDHDERNDGF